MAATSSKGPGVWCSSLMRHLLGRTFGSRFGGGFGSHRRILERRPMSGASAISVWLKMKSIDVVPNDLVAAARPIHDDHNLISAALEISQEGGPVLRCGCDRLPVAHAFGSLGRVDSEVTGRSNSMMRARAS